MGGIARSGAERGSRWCLRLPREALPDLSSHALFPSRPLVPGLAPSTFHRVQGASVSYTPVRGKKCRQLHGTQLPYRSGLSQDSYPKSFFNFSGQISIPFLSQTRYISGKYKVRVFLKLCPKPSSSKPLFGPELLTWDLHTAPGSVCQALGTRHLPGPWALSADTLEAAAIKAGISTLPKTAWRTAGAQTLLLG